MTYAIHLAERARREIETDDLSEDDAILRIEESLIDYWEILDEDDRALERGVIHPGRRDRADTAPVTLADIPF